MPDRIIRELEKVGNVLLLEDPLPRWMLQDFAELRRFSSIPIVLHISLPYVYQGQRPHDAINAIAHHAVDGFNFNGGLAKFQALDHIASTAKLYCWHGSEVDLGILEAMYVHQSAAARSCVWPSDIFGRMIRSARSSCDAARLRAALRAHSRRGTGARRPPRRGGDRELPRRRAHDIVTLQRSGSSSRIAAASRRSERGMRWEKFTTNEIAALDRSIPVVLNVAAIEQHGPHLPLETDARIGDHFLRRLEERLGDRVLILPQVKVCCSEHHMDFAGTLSDPARNLSALCRRDPRLRRPARISATSSCSTATAATKPSARFCWRASGRNTAIAASRC